MATIIEFEYEPLPVHQPFHRSSAREKIMFGAVGSGKSYALCSEAIARCLETPGLRALLARKYASNLRDTTETVFFDILPGELYKAGKPTRIGGHYESFLFPNGSKVLFRGVEEWQQHKSLNLGWAGYDEADELDEEILNGMGTRMRQRELTREAKALGYTHLIESQQVCLATNPAGKNFLYDRYVDQSNPKYVKDSEWFRSTSFDNPYLPGDFLNAMMEMPSMWVRRYVLCQFDEFSGSVYPSWNYESHVVPRRNTPWPPGTQFYMACDPGIQSPTAGLWVAYEPPKRTFTVIGEYQESDLAIKQHARNFRAIEARLKIVKAEWRVADPAIMQRDLGTNMTRHDMYRREGFSFQLGAKSHDIRVPALGELVYNGLFVASEDCPIFHEQMVKYRWQDITTAMRSRGVEHTERIQKGNDHTVDCAQYIASRQRLPSLPRTPPPSDKSDAQIFAEETKALIKKQELQKRKSRRQHKPGVII